MRFVFFHRLRHCQASPPFLLPSTLPLSLHHSGLLLTALCNIVPAYITSPLSLAIISISVSVLLKLNLSHHLSRLSFITLPLLYHSFSSLFAVREIIPLYLLKKV